MARKLWILFVLLLGTTSYGLALVSPLASCVEPTSGRDFWQTFFRQDSSGGGASKAFAEPVGGHFYVIGYPGCSRGSGWLYRASAAEVEAALPAALASLSPAGRPPRWGRAVERIDQVWRSRLLAKCEPELAAHQVTELTLELRAKATREFDFSQVDESGLKSYWLEEIKSQRRPPAWLVDGLESRGWRLLAEAVVWCVLLLLLLGFRPPTQVSPKRAAIRGGLWPLAVMCLGSLLVPSLWQGQFPRYYLTPGQAMARFVIPHPLYLLVLSLACASLAAYLTHRWRRERPAGLGAAIRDALSLSVPYALLLYGLSALLGLQEGVRALGISPLVSWEVSLGGTLWLATGLAVFAARAHTAPSAEEHPELTDARASERPENRAAQGRDEGLQVVEATA